MGISEDHCKYRGYVYIVGAGPGDPGLITLKGLQAISKADVILVDRLVPQELLAHARRDAEIIYVGKEPGRHLYTQDEINRIMIEKAVEGKIVVRLKGGDPLVFGRGGEEMEALRESGICYEVIPGISSAYAVPAYAGIPVTHRRVSSSVAIVPGMEAEDKPLRRVDLRRIAGTVDTIVVLMGISRAEEIARELIDGGLDENTPAAVIEMGATRDQRVLIIKLRELGDGVKRHGFRNPSIMVIGWTALLARRLCWFSCDRVIDEY
jgi:uroporphyrin-III C-methyltransferase